MIDTSVPVLVIHRGGPGELSIARTLGRLGVPVYLVAENGGSAPVWPSRYWANRRRWDFAVTEEESLAFLLDLGETIRTNHGMRAILLTTADWAAIFIERNCAALQAQFLFPRPVGPILRSLLNKWEMHLLATENRIPSPATTCPTRVEDIEEFLETTGFPIVMKAADRYLEDPPSTKVIHSRDELTDEVAHRPSDLNLVLQEYIPGDAETIWMCNGYFGENPRHAVIFTGQKLRQMSTTGIASLAICQPNETVAAQTRQFMEGVGYRGCVGIGYRYDHRDGLYKVLDVNARVSGVFRLFAGTNEMDVVRACYLDLTGQDVPATTLRPGRKWLLEDDVFVAAAAIQRGSLSIADWIRSLRGVQELHWLAADDPIPIFVWLRDGLRRVGRYLVKRTRAGLRESSPRAGQHRRAGSRP